jgi:hypothetical protein
MNMMYKLLKNVNKRWQTAPKDTAVVTIERASGKHTLVSIEGNQLYLHSSIYRSSLPSKQSIYLEDLTMDELVETINSMGYKASITSEGEKYRSIGSFTLMPNQNIPIAKNGGGELTAFTSKVWKALFPVAMLLEQVNGDIDLAIRQMYMSSASGKWLEYWATFFNIKRTVGETDSRLLRRITTDIVNPKTNNRSIEELVQYMLDSPVKVDDVQPAQFSVKLDASQMTYVDLAHELILEIKGAGMDYFLNFEGTEQENVKSYLADRVGGDMENMLTMKGHVELPRNRESRFGYEPYKPMFRTNRSKINGADQVVDVPKRKIANPDTYGAHFEWRAKVENYDRLRDSGRKSFRLNASKTNVSDRLFAKYHETAQYMGGSVESKHDEILPKSEENFNGSVQAGFLEPTFRSKQIGDDSFTTNESKLSGADRLTMHVERLEDSHAFTDAESYNQELYEVENVSMRGSVYMPKNDDVMPKGDDTGTAFEARSLVEEHSYKLRKSTDDSFVVGESIINGDSKLSPFIERMLEQYVSTAFEAKKEEVYEFNRTPQVKKTFFRTNKAKLNNSTYTLYGLPNYGDIMGMLANVESAETFPKTVESAGREITSPHAEHYQEPTYKGQYGFRVGFSKLSIKNTSKLSTRDRKTTDSCSMRMERNGVVVKIS